MGKKKNICIKCNKVFDSAQELQTHRQGCKQDPFGDQQKNKIIKKTSKAKKLGADQDNQSDYFFDQQSPTGWKPAKMCQQTLQIGLSPTKKEKVRRKKIVGEGQTEEIIGVGFKKNQGVWYCTVEGCFQLIGLNKGQLFEYDSQLKLKSHQRKKHGMSFEVVNNGDQVCFLCPGSISKTYYPTQLRTHLEIDHKINFEGKNVADIKKEYEVKKCVICQKNFQSCQLTFHYERQHQIVNKTWQEIHQLWDKFVNGRSQYENVNLNFKKTFLSRLKKEFVQTFNQSQQKMPQISKFLTKQAYYLDREGWFLVMALKNAFDLEIQWPVDILAKSVWSMLSKLEEEINQFKFINLHQVKNYIQESGLVEKKRRVCSKKVRDDLQKMGFKSQFKEKYFPTVQLYTHYEQLKYSNDCFTIHDQMFKIQMQQQRRSIQAKMGEFQVNYKEEKHYAIKRVGNKKRKQFITRQKALQRRIPYIFGRLKDQFFRKSLQDDYWNKTKRQALLFRRIFFKQLIFLPKWQRKYEREKKKEEEDKYVIPPQYFWRTLTREDAQQQLRKDMPKQIKCVQNTPKNEVKPKIFSDSQQEDQLTFRQRKWFEQNSSLCHPYYFHKDPEYRRKIMSYPFPQFYHRNLVQKILAKRHPELSQTPEQQKQRKQRYHAEFYALVKGQVLQKKVSRKFEEESHCISFLAQIGKFVEEQEEAENVCREQPQQMCEDREQPKEKCDGSEEGNDGQSQSQDIQIE